MKVLVNTINDMSAYVRVRLFILKQNIEMNKMMKEVIEENKKFKASRQL